MESREPIRLFRDLRVWREAVVLTAIVYPLARTLPKEEQYGLASQLRRAAVSGPANIAEGHGRRSTRAYLYHLSIARGSLTEVEALLSVAVALELFTEQQIAPARGVVNAAGRMVSGLANSLRRRSHPEVRAP